MRQKLKNQILVITVKLEGQDRAQKEHMNAHNMIKYGISIVNMVQPISI